jgi:imidazolonepropionase-like amidohydrolase
MKNTQEILVDKLNRNASLLKVGYGSDAGYDMPLANNNWREMEAMVSIGFTPIQALKSATTDAAKILGLSNIGNIATNKTADIVAWNGDITRDWNATRESVFVMKDGIIYKSPK